MKHIEIYTLIVCGLFYFSEGKPCPEKTRPHKTRCEVYYKCTQLPSKFHVWVPEKCEQGLIYEHGLGMCVLPGDDWECMLGEATDAPTTMATKTANQIGFKQKKKIESATNVVDKIDVESYGKMEQKTLDNDVQLIVGDDDISSEETKDNDQYDGSGDGVALMQLDGFLQAENKDNQMMKNMDKQMPGPQKKESAPIQQTTTSKIDPNLTAHLQRLSQLIDGLKQTYQAKDQQQTELRPDQLNAFLAHFDIKNKFDTLNLMPENPAMSNVSQNYPLTKLKPEMKIGQISGTPRPYISSGYANPLSVNMQTYSSDNPFGDHTIEFGQNTPKISEEALRRVLELSNQMIATQNIPKIIPNPAYIPQTIYQPWFIPPQAFPGGVSNPFSTYLNVNNNKEDYENNDKNYLQPQSSSYSQKKNPNSYSKPGTTIIHNNVIPLHVTATSSGEKEIVDSYGQSLGLYPPLNVGEHGNQNNYQTVNHHHIHSHRYENNKYGSSVTTVRPAISTTPGSQYVGPSPEIPSSTSSPFDYQPSAAAIAEYYTPSPHLDNNNINSLFQPSDRYPTIQFGNIPRPMDLNRPSALSSSYQGERPNQQITMNGMGEIFPIKIDPDKVKVRPNSQKIESMEVENDEMVLNAYNNQQQQQQNFGFNYNNNKDTSDFSNNPISQSALLGLSGLNNNQNLYLPRPQMSSSSTYGANIMPSKNKYPLPGSQSTGAYPDGTQLVNIGGNFIKYDVFQNALMPVLGNSQVLNELNNVEVITCATGVRTPNSTDCTRYYVCSKKDGKVLSYSCPPYTAFNAQSRICDARTYSICRSDSISNSYPGTTENKRIQLEALHALQEAQRRREQALKSQAIASLLQQFGGNVVGTPASPAIEESNDSNEKNMLNIYMQQASALSQSAVVSTTVKPVKKRKYYCKEGDKIADQTSIYNYFVCYKNAQGMMKGHKMTCSKGLIFCSKTTMCTLSTRCT